MAPRVTMWADSARATSAAESRYRIDYPLAPARAPRVIALDPGADQIVERVASLAWDTATFYTSGTKVEEQVVLSAIGGATVPLEDTLDAVDAVILVATEDSGSDTALHIAKACWSRSIMVAGLVIGTGDLRETVAHLRPFARILLVSFDEHDLEAILVAIRA